MAKDPAAPEEGRGLRREPEVRTGSVPSSPPRIVGASLESRPVGEHLAAEAVLDKLNRGIVIFDQERRVHFLNDAAVRQIHRSGSIAVVGNQLTFLEPGAQARLLAFLQRFIETSRDPASAAQSATVMRVDAGPGRAPYRVLLSALRVPANPATGSRDLRHVLMIYEPHEGQVISKRILVELYGLTDTEAEVALLLFRGESLESASQQLGVSVNTAKTHLQHIFLKCDVHSQGDLLQLLSLGPRTL